MAYMPSLDDEEQTVTGMATGAAASGSGSAIGGSGGGGAGAASTGAAGGQAGTGFVNLEQYLGLNQDAGAQMAGRVAGELKQTGNQLREEIRYTPGGWGNASPGLQTQVGDLKARARTASGADAGTLIADTYGKGGQYNTGMQGLDSFLANAAGGNEIRQTVNGTENLESMLGIRPAGSGPVETGGGTRPGRDTETAGGARPSGQAGNAPGGVRPQEPTPSIGTGLPGVDDAKEYDPNRRPGIYPRR